MSSLALQNTFYILGIIFMTIMIILMVSVVVVIFVIKRKIDEVHKNINEKLNFLKFNSADIVSGVGTAVGNMAVEKVKGIFKRKKSE